MKKLYLFMVLTLFLIVCGGGNTRLIYNSNVNIFGIINFILDDDDTESEPEIETYNSFAGSGFGSRRLKQSISTEQTTTYFYHDESDIALRGRLQRFETIREDSSEAGIFEYDALGNRSSRIITISTSPDSETTVTISNDYGSVAFREPLLSPTVSSSTFESIGNSCGSINGGIEYTYNIDAITLRAISLAKTVLSTEAIIDPETCQRTNVTVERAFTYDDIGRLQKEETTLLETDFVTSTITYTYDSSNRLSTVTDISALNTIFSGSSVTNYGVDSQGRAFAENTIDTNSNGESITTEHIYEDEPCFYHYIPNFAYPSGERSIGLCLR